MIVIIVMIMGNFQYWLEKNSDKIDKAFNDAMVVYHVSELYDEAE